MVSTQSALYNLIHIGYKANRIEENQNRKAGLDPLAENVQPMLSK